MPASMDRRQPSGLGGPDALAGGGQCDPRLGRDPNVVPRCPYCGYDLIMIVWFDHQTLASFGRANADDYEIICPHCGHERMPVPSSCGVYRLKW